MPFPARIAVVEVKPTSRLIVIVIGEFTLSLYEKAFSYKFCQAMKDRKSVLLRRKDTVKIKCICMRVLQNTKWIIFFFTSLI